MTGTMTVMRMIMTRVMGMMGIRIMVTMRDDGDNNDGDDGDKDHGDNGRR